MSQYVVFKIVTYAMIEYIFELTRNETAIQSNLVITRSPGGIFWDRGISEARYRVCRQVFFIL